MSYDVHLGVKVAGTKNLIVSIDSPDFRDPTYNITRMLRNCMKWEFQEGKWYKVKDVMPYIEHGAFELNTFPFEYKQYELPGGYGQVKTARDFLNSLCAKINELTQRPSEPIPVEKLYMRW